MLVSMQRSSKRVMYAISGCLFSTKGILPSLLNSFSVIVVLSIAASIWWPHLLESVTKKSEHLISSRPRYDGMGQIQIKYYDFFDLHDTSTCYTRITRSGDPS